MTMHRIHAPIMPGPRKPRYRTYKISYWSLLAARMSRAPLMKTFVASRPVWSVGGELVDPALVQQSIASGHLITRDPSLFGDDNALTYRLNPTPGDRPPPVLPAKHNVERWVARAMRLKCAVCDNPVYSSKAAARADIEQILGSTPTIDDLKDALANTAHGGRLCHVHA